MAAKICVVCGADVSQTKRVKDPQGNYYCEPCYNARLAQARRGAAGGSRGGAEADYVCAVCQRRFTVDDVYDDAGKIICKGCFVAQSQPAQASPPLDQLDVLEEAAPPAAIPAAAAPLAQGVDQLEVVEDPPAASAAQQAPQEVALVWHVHDKGQNHGPFSEDEFLAALHEGRFTTAAQIWKEGLDNWVSVLQAGKYVKL